MAPSETCNWCGGEATCYDPVEPEVGACDDHWDALVQAMRARPSAPLPVEVKPPPSRPGVIYAIKEHGGPVKVGWAVSPMDRLRVLQTGNPRKLRIVLTWSGTVLDEQEIHRRFAHLRVSGEWFDASILGNLRDVQVRVPEWGCS